MHAANLLNKKRQLEERRREEREKHVGTPTSGSTPTGPTSTNRHQNSKQHLLVDHQSLSTSSMALNSGGSGAGVPPRSPVPPTKTQNISLPTTISFNVEQKPKKHKESKKKIMGPKLIDSNTSTAAATPTLYYHKEANFFNCAHVGLCIMILGVIIMTITGFVSHLLGFGEPGVIIVTGGACFCAVGLLLLCFGNAWYIRRSKKKAGILSFVEIGRASLEGNELVAP